MLYKILYVEDQPDETIIRELFEKYIGKSFFNLRIQSPVIEHFSQEAINDPYNENKENVKKVNPARTYDGYYAIFDQLPMVDFAPGLLDKIDKDGKTRPGALSLLKKHANEYLLFIIDRDLFGGKKGKSLEELASKELKEIQDKSDIWPGFCGSKYNHEHYYSGDLLLEYLCLESRLSKKEILARFRFLSANDPMDIGDSDNEHREQNERLKNFLEALHFSTQEVRDAETKSDLRLLTVDKSSRDQLKDLINDPAAFYIQCEHKDVFNALGKSADDLAINYEDHKQNLIKALSYAEGIKLNGVDIEEPSISLLRALGEAIKDRARKLAITNYELTKSNIEGLISSANKVQSDICDVFFKKQNTKKRDEWLIFSLGAHNVRYKKIFNILKLQPYKLFEPPKDNELGFIAKNLIQKFNDEYRHYGDLLQLVHTITSQEIHHNEREPLSGKRLQLVTYAICELLLFYHTALKGDNIEVNEDDWHKSRVIDVMAMANNNGQVYSVPFCVLKCFEDYIGKADLNEQYLETLGFEIEKMGGNSPTVKYQLP